MNENLLNLKNQEAIGIINFIVKEQLKKINLNPKKKNKISQIAKLRNFKAKLFTIESKLDFITDNQINILRIELNKKVRKRN